MRTHGGQTRAHTSQPRVFPEPLQLCVCAVADALYGQQELLQPSQLHRGALVSLVLGVFFFFLGEFCFSCVFCLFFFPGIVGTLMCDLRLVLLMFARIPVAPTLSPRAFYYASTCAG